MAKKTTKTERRIAWTIFRHIDGSSDYSTFTAELERVSDCPSMYSGVTAKSLSAAREIISEGVKP